MEPPEMAGWNLALRFALEIVALVALGLAGVGRRGCSYRHRGSDRHSKAV